jgi:hypothetical protein
MNNNELIYDEPEIWLPIIGYEGRYEISSYGRLRSLFRNRIKLNYPALRKIHINSDGYHIAKIFKDKTMTTVSVHLLVARHFIPNPENLPEVNHLKEKTNNYYKHLEWVTSRQNQVHAYATGRKQLPKFEMNGRAILNRNQVMSIFQSDKTQRQLSVEYGVSMATINNIKNGYAWCEITGINKKKDEPMYRSALPK